MKRRVAITGIGIASPIGCGAEAFWEAALDGRGAVAPVPPHWLDYYKPQSTIWAPLPKIDWLSHGLNRLELMQLDMVEMLALASSRMALDDAGWGLESADEKKNTMRIATACCERWGVFAGTGVGGVSSLVLNQAFHVGTALAASVAPEHAAPVAKLSRSPFRFNPMAVAMTMPSGVSSCVGIKFGLTGRNVTVATACAAGTSAIAQAYNAVASGELDCAVTGGAEYLADEFGGVFRGFDTARTLVNAGDTPDSAYCPFDTSRSGFLFAEGGAAILILEELELARARGARIYAELCGAAETFDAHSIMAMEPSGRNAERMVRMALEQSGVEPSQIDYLNAHGTGTVLNDEAETAMIERVFGDRVLVNSTKSLVGHTIGASGAIEAAVTALSIHGRTTHVCRNLRNPIRPLNFVREVREREIFRALTQSFAFGGHNACLVLGAVK